MPERKKKIPVLNVRVAEVKAAKNPSILQILALGSCVGVCLYDSNKKVGGVAHIMLPKKQYGVAGMGRRYRFADKAIPALIKKMQKLGASKANLKARLVGGAKLDLRRAPKLKIGEKNISSVHEVLLKENIIVDAEVVGGKQRTSLIFDTETGNVYVSRGESVREKI